MVAKRTVLVSAAVVAAATLFSRFSASAEEHELPTERTSMAVASSRAPPGTAGVPHGALPEVSPGGRIAGVQNPALSPPHGSETALFPTAVESDRGRGAAVENPGARPDFEERAEDRKAGAKRGTPDLESSAEEAQVTRRRSAGLAPWARENRSSPLVAVAVTLLAVALTYSAVNCVKRVKSRVSNAIDEELKELASRAVMLLHHLMRIVRELLFVGRVGTLANAVSWRLRPGDTNAAFQLSKELSKSATRYAEKNPTRVKHSKVFSEMSR
ncbi:UNVERIFIED_CONTAM: hypothetical protein HHA_244170 [Hammondia hammondi]|eukprot:XP_008884283.1 hypothetical protein HHA_244170 [Hammondia hammondi]